ncbi:MAG: hypothetical protein QOF49_339 [Chloroflexota bacterium]|nr:hypothetical protein [Chloroflexota bacterium]
MELLVGALAILGFAAIIGRMLPRDAGGGVQLPRVVDDSVGMWALRRLTGRPLGERPWIDDHAADGVAPTLPAGPDRPTDRPAGPRRIEPIRYVVSRSHAHPVAARQPVAPTGRPQAGRRDQARRRGRVGLAPSLAVVAGVAMAAVLAGVLFVGNLSGLADRSDGEVLAATGRPHVGGSMLEIAPTQTVEPSTEPADRSVAPPSDGPTGSGDGSTAPSGLKPTPTPPPTVRPTATPVPTATAPPTATPTAPATAAPTPTPPATVTPSVPPPTPTPSAPPPTAPPSAGPPPSPEPTPSPPAEPTPS